MHDFCFQCMIYFHAEPCLDLKSFLDNKSKNPHTIGFSVPVFHGLVLDASYKPLQINIFASYVQRDI